MAGEPIVPAKSLQMYKPDEAAETFPASVVAQLMETLAQLPDGVLLMDRQWRITYANPRGRVISRFRPEDLNGPTHWELFPTTVGTEVEQRYHRVMYERVEDEFTFFYAPFQVWLKIRVLPAGEGIAILYSDVTELHEAQTQRDAAMAQVQQIFAVTTDAVIALNPEWTITFLNDAARRLTGPSGDVLGKNLWHAFPHQVFEGSEVVRVYYRAMVQREAGSLDTFYPEPLHVWVHVEAQPFEGGIVLFVRDVTQQHRDAERLQQERAETERQRSELEAIYDTAPVGLALFEPEEFRYLRVNRRQAETLGRPVADLIGRRVQEIVTQPDVLRMFERVRSGETIRDYTYQTELVGRPEETRTFNVNYSPICTETGEVRAISAAVLEVTKQHKAEKALMQSEKLAAVGRLASSISHEINNPLEAVTNLLYLAVSDTGLTEEGRSYVRMAQDELTRVSQIATQTLRFHRQSNSPIRVTAAQLVDPVLNLYHGRLVNSRIHVEASYSTTRNILCFENDIRQVLNNLIANAIDAMRNGGRLIIRAHNQCDLRSEAEGVRISVTDTGHGMSEATLRRVFEPFYTTKDVNGNGLGLWISQGIVERHQGQLHVRSSQDERAHGTIFTLFLPSSDHPLPSL